MSNWVKRVFCVSVMLLMVLAGFVMFAGTVGQKGVMKNVNLGEKSTRAGDYVHLNDPLTTYYPGDRDNTFTITVDNDNDGSEWNDPDTGDLVDDNHWPYGDGYVICYTKITIEAVRDANHNPVANDPLENFDKTVYNAYGDVGYNVTDWAGQSYVHNEDGDPFSFDVKNTVTPGDYTLQVKVTYFLRLSWDNTNLRYGISTIQTETEYIEFTIVSGLEPSPYDNEIFANAYDNDGSVLNGGFLYAGASFQEIRIPVSAKGFDMENIQATLSPVGITLSNTDPAKISFLGSWDTSYLAFRIEVPKNLPPQIMDSTTMSLSYTRDDQGETQTISETGIKIQMIIDYTPLLSPPADNDYSTVADTINQGNTVEDFATYTFSNTGNVKLQDIQVNLDISAAKYFSNGAFYYDEGAYGTMKPLRPITYDIDEVGVGLTKTVEFPNCLINKYLPPGYYKIPITYDAWYYDTGEIAGSTSWKMTNENEYGTIYQATTGAYAEPYLFVQVEDTNGFSGDADSSSKMEQGEQSANIALTISNFEYYPVRSVTFSLENCDGLTPVDTEISQSILVAANDATGPGKAYLNFEVNVDATATPGVKTGYVKMVGYDLSNEEVNVTFAFTYEILPIPALLTIVGVQTGSISPGKTFNMIVTVKNIGGSTASNVKVLLSLTNNLFLLASPSEMAISSLAAGAQANVNFTVKADKNIDQGATYTNFVYLKWTDVKGNNVQYSDNAPAAFSIKTTDNTQKSTFSLATSLLWAGIIVAVVILLFGLMVFLGIKSVAASLGPKTSVKSEPATPAPKPPPPEPPAKAKPMDEDTKGDKGPDMTPPPDVQEF